MYEDKPKEWYEVVYDEYDQLPRILQHTDNGVENDTDEVYDETNIEGWIKCWKGKGFIYKDWVWHILDRHNKSTTDLTSFCKIVFNHPEFFDLDYEARLVPYEKVNPDFLLGLVFDFPHIVRKLFEKDVVAKPEKGSEYTSPFLIACSLGNKIRDPDCCHEYPEWVDESAKMQIEQVANSAEHEIGRYCIKNQLFPRKRTKRCRIVNLYDISDENQKQNYLDFIKNEINEAIIRENSRNRPIDRFKRKYRRIQNKFKENITGIIERFPWRHQTALPPGVNSTPEPTKPTAKPKGLELDKALNNRTFRPGIPQRPEPVRSSELGSTGSAVPRQSGLTDSAKQQGYIPTKIVSADDPARRSGFGDCEYIPEVHTPKHDTALFDDNPDTDGPYELQAVSNGTSLGNNEPKASTSKAGAIQTVNER